MWIDSRIYVEKFDWKEYQLLNVTPEYNYKWGTRAMKEEIINKYAEDVKLSKEISEKIDLECNCYWRPRVFQAKDLVSYDPEDNWYAYIVNDIWILPNEDINDFRLIFEYF